MSENRFLISRPLNIEANRRHPRENNISIVGRPLSAYDNLCETSNNYNKRNSSKDFFFSDIKFQFDKFPSMISSNNNPTTNMQHNNHLENQGCCDQTTTTSSTATTTTKNSIDVEAAANDSNRRQYENVLETIQARNQQQQKQQQQQQNYLLENRNRNCNGKPVISDAKSSFFGLNTSQSVQIDEESESEFDKLIVESEKICGQIMSNHSKNNCNQYENLENDLTDLNKSSEESTVRIGSSSSNASSSSTITPSHSPRRMSKTDSKSSTSNISTRSPKFTLPKTEETRSQAVYLTTTVPQNIKGTNIVGRHKPTRNSLRHSRHLVMSSSFKSPPTINSLNIKYLKLAKAVLTLKIIIGTILTSLGVWILLWAPSTRIRDNPYWSGLILILSGVLGLYLLSFKRIRSTKLKQHCFLFLKFNDAVVIILCIFLTTLAFIYAMIHFISLSSTNKECLPENILEASSSCICIFNKNAKANGLTSSMSPHIDSSGNIEINGTGFEFHYRDLSCNEVLDAWVYMLLASSILNLLGLFLSIIFLWQFIFGCKRKTYIQVRN